MAHLININANGRANMAYQGETPWHGLGQRLLPGATIPEWAIAAGMDYTIERSRVAFRWGEGKGEVGVMGSRHVLWRSDTKAPLAVMSDGYKIVQPGEVLEFYRDLVAASGDYELETAGVLDDGGRYWALAKYRDAFTFGRDDKVQPYLLLATSCDGSMATTAQHTSVRVVCNNTLQMSLHGGAGQSVKVRHSTRFDAAKVRAELGVADTAAAFFDDVDALINKAINREQAAEIFVDLVAKRDSAGKIENEDHTKRVARELMTALTNAPGASMETARGTGWGVLNAVTNHVDFTARARSANNRFKSGQFGAGAAMKQRAYELVMAA